jgi:hypothetical protein
VRAAAAINPNSRRWASDLRVGLVELLDQRVDVGHRIDAGVDTRAGRTAIGEGSTGRFEHAIDATGGPDRCL